MTDLIKRGNLDADMCTGRLLHEDQGRDWGDATVSHGTPKIFNKPPGARQGTWDRLSPMGLTGSSPTSTLAFRLLACTAVRQQISVSHPAYGTLLRQS